MWVSPERLQSILGDTATKSDLQALSVGQADLHIPASNAANVRRIAEDIRLCPYSGAARSIFLQGKLLELLVEGISAPQMSQTERIAHKIRSILLADPMNPPSQNQLAEMTGLKWRKLDEYFRETFGVSIFKWLTEWRLIRARDLVLRGDLPITNISTMSGYAHLPTFVSAFTRRFGVSPRRLRSEIRGDGLAMHH